MSNNKPTYVFKYLLHITQVIEVFPRASGCSLHSFVDRRASPMKRKLIEAASLSSEHCMRQIAAIYLTISPLRRNQLYHDCGQRSLLLPFTYFTSFTVSISDSRSSCTTYISDIDRDKKWQSKGFIQYRIEIKTQHPRQENVYGLRDFAGEFAVPPYSIQHIKLRTSILPSKNIYYLLSN